MNDILLQNLVSSNISLSNISLGTHNSGAIGSNFNYCLSTNNIFYSCFLMVMNMLFYSGWADCQTLTLKEQVYAGVNMFDLRYIYNKVDNQFIISHTFPTIYTLYTALTDIFTSSINRSIITIKLEHDSGINELYPVNTQIEPNKLIELFKTIADGRFYNNLILPLMYNKSFNLLTDEIYVNNAVLPAVLLYSNNYVLELSSIIHNESNIFDSINTWSIVLLSSVKTVVNELKFINNGYPKILHITWNAGGILTPFSGKYILSTLEFNRTPVDLYAIFIDNINDNNSIYMFHFIFNSIFILFYGIFLISVFSYIIIFIFRFIITIDCNQLCTYTRHRSLS